MTPMELRKWLETNEMTTGPLAKMLRVARTTVYRWVNGAVALPADLESQLGAALAARDTAMSQDDEYSTTSCPLGFEPASETPHGQVIGLTRAFWQQPDAARIAWITDAEYPFRALPWPWWSPGWSYWPPSQLFPERFPDKKRIPPPAREEPHWLGIEARRVVDAMSKGEGFKIGIIRLCERDRPTWFDKRQITAVPEEFLKDIKKLIDG